MQSKAGDQVSIAYAEQSRRPGVDRLCGMFLAAIGKRLF
jgi:hypothetical protein